MQPLLHFLLLGLCFCFSGFPISEFSGVLTILADDNEEHEHKCEDSKQRLDHTFDNDPFRNRADLFADDTLFDEVGQKPFGPFDGYVAQCFAVILIGKGYNALVPFLEVFLDLIQRISRIKLSMCEGIEKVCSTGLFAKHSIGEGNTVVAVEIAEGCVVFCGINGDTAEHLLHIQLHKRDDQPIVFKLLWGDRNSNDDFLFFLLRVLDRDVRFRHVFIIKSVLGNLVDRSG